VVISDTKVALDFKERLNDMWSYADKFKSLQ